MNSVIAFLVIISNHLTQGVNNPAWIPHCETRVLALLNLFLAKAVARRCSVKKVFLEVSQNSQENTCA